jgi:intracellular sulfur oxidation DsrE/DsrF family protein
MRKSVSFLTFASILLGIALCLFPSISKAQSKPDDHVALAGMTAVKAFIDIGFDNPNKLLGHLTMVEAEMSSLTAQGVKPEFIVAFFGGASPYVSKDRKYITFQEYEIADKIQAKVKAMSSKGGIRFEQCGYSANLRKMDVNSFVPEVTVIGNSMSSAIGYANKGYVVIRMD